MKRETLATKKTLADELRIEKKHLTASDAKDIVDIIFDSITNQLTANRTVEIHGFGKFETVPVRQRSGINPATGEKITISARIKPKFVPSKVLKEAIDPEIWSQVDTRSKQKEIKIIAYVRRLQRKYNKHLAKPRPQKIESQLLRDLDLLERSRWDGSLAIKETRSDLLQRAHEVRHYYQGTKKQLKNAKLHHYTKRELLVFMIETINE